MSLLQRELDFSEFESTSDDLLREWAPENRVIRSHRRRPRFTRLQILALIVGVLGALGVGGGVAPPTPVQAGRLASPAPPPDTDLAAAGVTDTVEVVERRGGDRASRTAVSRSLVNRTPRVRDVARTAVRWVSPVRRIKITSCFGPRWGRVHEGLDFDGETGDAIRAVGAGVVVQAGWRYSGLGNSVVVDHGRWLTIYAHASRTLVRVGQHVAAGTKIALVGATGHVTGTHLHLALSNAGTLSRAWNSLVDPAPWLRARGVAVPRC